MCADYIDSSDDRARLEMAEFSGETLKRISQKSYEFASLHNPLDLTAVADDDMYLNALEAVLDDPGVDIVICIAFFAPPSISKELVSKISAVIRRSEKPVLIFTQYGPHTDVYLKEFYDEGVAGFSSIHRVVRAARYLVERGKIIRKKEQACESGCC